MTKSDERARTITKAQKERERTQQASTMPSGEKPAKYDAGKETHPEQQQADQEEVLRPHNSKNWEPFVFIVLGWLFTAIFGVPSLPWSTYPSFSLWIAFAAFSLLTFIAYYVLTRKVWRGFSNGLFKRIGFGLVLAALVTCVCWQYIISQKQALERSKISKPVPYQPPSVKFETHLVRPTDPPYPSGLNIGGIAWSNEYAEVRLNVTNGSVPIQNLDFNVALDVDAARRTINTSIIGIGQLSRFPDVNSYPVKDVRLGMQVIDEKGKESMIPLEEGVTGSSFKSLGTTTPIYRVHCAKHLNDAVLRLVVAGVSPLGKATPRKITIWGSYEAPGENGSPQKYFFDESFPLTKP